MDLVSLIMGLKRAVLGRQGGEPTLGEELVDDDEEEAEASAGMDFNSYLFWREGCFWKGCLALGHIGVSVCILVKYRAALLLSYSAPRWID